MGFVVGIGVMEPLSEARIAAVKQELQHRSQQYQDTSVSVSSTIHFTAALLLLYCSTEGSSIKIHAFVEHRS